MMNDEADEVIKGFFDPVKNSDQNNLVSIKGIDFDFVYVHLLYYQCHKINLNCNTSNVDSPEWIENKKATTNPINKKYNMTSIHCSSCIKLWRNKKNPQRIRKTKPFINEYNWEGINFQSEKDDWQKFDKNIVKIAANILYAKKEKIYPAYVSKHNSNRQTQVTF